jgi:hypothetical protein
MTELQQGKALATPGEMQSDRSGHCIRERYVVEARIGKGGMAVVYRARDTITGRLLALKQAVKGTDERMARQSASFLEREFRALAQLSHPQIIEVYEFGVDEHGSFYTMELLDGGDLRERCPMPWKDACAIGYDICSSLALLHSRRLVHRDVSPRNVRCTRDGRTKLIDFGAMVPMGAGSVIVGTPLFTAPEVVHRSNLDARTDLFSLGATLYYALTGRAPYMARDLTEAAAAWKTNPRPPSYFAESPEGLDALVLELVAMDPATRPRTAFEVMHRLAVISGRKHQEPPQVSRAYLSTPGLVGRDAAMAVITKEMTWAHAGHGHTVLVEGAPGMGRSRLLDACSLVAETLGAGVLRAGGRALGRRAFETARTLALRLVEDSPESAVRNARDAGVFDLLFEESIGESAGTEPKLRDLRSSRAARYDLQTALSRWFSKCSEERALAIAVDDVHSIDEPSLALLATLSTEAERRRIMLIATAETAADPADRLAFDVLAKHATRLTLEPLGRGENERLFESVFGDVPNVAIVSDGIHAIAAGNPRAAMDLAQHLVDRGTVRYERGSWTLPPHLPSSDLPRDAEEAIRTRLAALTPLARWLAEAQSLATYRAFTRDDYEKLRSDRAPSDIDGAIIELLTERIVSSDGRVYSLAHGGFDAALLQGLSEKQQAERHRALVSLYEGKLPLGVVRHALFGGLEERALNELSPILPGLPEATNLYELTDLGAMEAAATFERALTAAERIGRPALETNHLRRWLASLSVVSHDKYYFRVAPAWLDRLKHDSGYSIWEAIDDAADAGERLSRAMQGAFAEYAATPDGDRVYRPDEAVKGLAHYVGISLAIGSSRLELPITESLPALLEPFAPISPLVHTIWRNALATRESSCRTRWEHARTGWISVYEQLSALREGDAALVGVFQRAVAYAIGAVEATMGIASAVKWAGLLDDDPAQRVNGVHIRRIVRLQHGDLEGAETLRKQAEVLALKARSRQMFAHLQWVELVICGMARDLTGVKQCEDRLRASAARSPGWEPYVALAEGTFCLCCDDFDGARAAFERVLAMTAPRPEAPWPLVSAWSLAAGAHVESLSGLGRHDEARRVGESALATCSALEIGVASHCISRAVAMAEAKTGDPDRAAVRLEAVIQNQTELGVTGVHLGATFEARARVAIAAGDREGFQRYARLTALEYRHGHGSPLGARYERLARDGLAVDAAGLPNLADLDSASVPRTNPSSPFAAARLVLEMMKDTACSRDRAVRVLDVLCDAAGASRGHLYLIRDEGLELAASRPTEPPPADLAQSVRQHLDRALDESASTQILEDTDEATVAFSDTDEVRYRPLLLGTPSGRELRYAAVAALVVDDGARAVPQEIIVALADYLIRLGDTGGARSS